ncbi:MULTISPECIES: TetR/AcrR family transcriptional regulator [Streptomyces]|uniref:TetR/AcrR family transcriptional regulator n=1 Tax=Streptomyces TaxID=1883 RepID=UPI00087A7BA9|nr:MULTISPECIES: TetR/AcrR family transcriptional regulator [unclassified Streptomyces]REH19474.1 TetR family transcriptional regulator [Streptomyces sp. 2221.1]SDS81870.1 transcriptional regulator, TetR family [Streptomyces sp. 2114.2]
MAQRRRGAALEKALLDAAWGELAERGYARFTMDGVVRRAGTSPPVLYRRWAHRDELARAAVAHVLEEARVDTPDTGTLRGDLLALMREIGTANAQLVILMYAHLAGYCQETGTSPGELLDAARGKSADALAEVYDRAVARGEARPERLTARVRSLPFDLLRQEILATLAPVPEDVVEEIVDTIFLPLVS